MYRDSYEAGEGFRPQRRKAWPRKQLLDDEMTIATLQQFKDYVRELTNDLDDTFELALESASAECNHYLGFEAEDSGGAEPDIVMACCLLAAVHGDVGDPTTNTYRERAARRLLDPYRLNSGIGAAESES